MNVLDKYLRMPLSLYEIGDALAVLPTPRRRLFNLIVAVSGLTPNTVKMILSNTAEGYVPAIEIRKRISKALGKNTDELFAEDRSQDGSMFRLYKGLSAKKIELHQLVRLLSQATRASPKTVRKWLRQHNVPKRVARKEIANALGMPITQLFPQEEGNKSHAP